MDATNCSEWCEVEWQGKKGFAIATALDRSGRVPAPRTAARPRRCPPPGAAAYVETTTTCRSVRRWSMARPAPYYYGYGYRPYYGYRRGYGYGYGYRLAVTVIAALPPLR